MPQGLASERGSDGSLGAGRMNPTLQKFTSLCCQGRALTAQGERKGGDKDLWPGYLPGIQVRTKSLTRNQGEV